MNKGFKPNLIVVLTTPISLRGNRFARSPSLKKEGTFSIPLHSFYIELTLFNYTLGETSGPRTFLAIAFILPRKHGKHKGAQQIFLRNSAQ